MKNFKLLFAFLLCVQSSFCQDITGSWSGEIKVQGTTLPLIFNIVKNGTELTSTLDSPAQGAKGIAVTSTIFKDNELLIQAANLNLEFKGIYKTNQIDGVFSQGGLQLPMVLTKKATPSFVINRPQEPKPPFTYTVEEVSFVNPKDNNTLAATLTTPKNKATFPIAIMITGSGSQNRNEEVFGHKPFWVIADDFANKGIGVLRIDDRGVGQSSKGSQEDTTENFASDINTAVTFLNNKGFDNIGLIGHSEGGLIAPMVAAKNKNVKFIIAMAAPGIPVDQLLLLQTAAVSKSQGAKNEEINSSAMFNQKVYAFIKNYSASNLKMDLKTVLIAELKKLPKEQAVPQDKIDDFVKSQLQQLSSPWFVYFLKCNPDDYWSKITIPVLAINGTNDVQVTATENLKGIENSLRKANNKNFEIQQFDGLNHLFQDAKTGAVSEYATIEQTISPKVLDKMSTWILNK